MTDLVERLRRRHEQAAENYGELDLTLWSEAANEIERLLAERKYLGELHRQEWEAQVARTEKAEAEIERLRAEIGWDRILDAMAYDRQR